jgi:hypothetical protein
MTHDGVGKISENNPALSTVEAPATEVFSGRAGRRPRAAPRLPFSSRQKMRTSRGQNEKRDRTFFARVSP